MKHLPLFRRKTVLLALVGIAGLSAASSCARREATAELTVEPAAAARLVSQADSLYAERASIEKARQAASLLKQARMSDYSNYDVAWKLARCDYYIGSHEQDDDAQLKAFREGITASEAAVKLAPDKPEGHFWLGANLGGRAEAQGPLYALSSVPDIRREMETVIKLDEGFQSGSAYLALGQIDLDLPEVMGGDRKRAVETLEKGLRFGADNALLHEKLAEAYYESKRPADARAQANAVLKMKPSPEYQPEYEEAAKDARELLQKVASSQ